MTVGDDAGDDVGDGDIGGDDAGNNAGEGDGGDAGGEGGGGLLVEDAAAAAVTAASGSGSSGNGGSGGCILQGLLLFIVKIFLCGIFMVCGGNWQGHTSPQTLITLEVCRHMFGWGRKLSSKIVVCKYQKLASKKAWQPKLVVFYTKVLGTKMNPSHCRNWYCVPKTPIWYRTIMCWSQYHTSLNTSKISYR